MQPDVAQCIGHRLMRRHVGLPAGAQQGGEGVIVIGGEFQRIVAARADHRLLDAEFALDRGAGDQHRAQAGDQIAERLAQLQHGGGRVGRLCVRQAGALEEGGEQRVSSATGLWRRGRRRGRRRRQRVPVTAWLSAACGGPVPWSDAAAGAVSARLSRFLPEDPCPSRPAEGRRRVSRRRCRGACPIDCGGRNASSMTGEWSGWVGPRNGVSRRVRRQRIEVVRQLRRRRAVRGLRWSGSSNGLRCGRGDANGSMPNGSPNGCRPTRARSGDGILHQPYLDLVDTEPDPVAVAQVAHIAGADRVDIAVQKRAVGRCVGELPDPAADRPPRNGAWTTAAPDRAAPSRPRVRVQRRNLRR